MKRNCMLIDLRNAKEVEWFNKKASKLVKCIKVDSIVENGTGKEIAVVLKPVGLFAKKIIKEHDKKFIGKKGTLFTKMAK